MVIVGNVCGDFRCPLPRRLGVAPVKGNDLSDWHGIHHPGPSGFCVKRHIHAGVDGELFQGNKVAGGARVFVIELDPHDRTAVPPQQSIHLSADLSIEPGDGRKVFRMLRPQSPAIRTGPMRAVFNPIRKTSVSGFSIAPRPAAHNREQPHLATCLKKSPQILIPTPIPLPLNFLVVVPKHIGRNNANAAVANLFQ